MANNSSGKRLKKWDLVHIPDLQDKVIIITGGNVGLGYQSSLELARRGAKIIIAVLLNNAGVVYLGSSNTDRFQPEQIRYSACRKTLGGFRGDHQFQILN